MVAWSVEQSRSTVFGAAWHLLRTESGVSRTVASFGAGDEAEQLAKRCRDLLEREGLVAVDLPEGIEG